VLFFETFLKLKSTVLQLILENHLSKIHNIFNVKNCRNSNQKMTISCFNHLHIALMLISTVLAQQIQSSPIAAESHSAATSEKPMRALKMLGPVPLKPGQSNGQTEYFDPKVIITLIV